MRKILLISSTLIVLTALVCFALQRHATVVDSAALRSPSKIMFSASRAAGVLALLQLFKVEKAHACAAAGDLCIGPEDCCSGFCPVGGRCF